MVNCSCSLRYARQSLIDSDLIDFSSNFRFCGKYDCEKLLAINWLEIILEFISKIAKPKDRQFKKRLFVFEHVDGEI